MMSGWRRMMTNLSAEGEAGWEGGDCVSVGSDSDPSVLGLWLGLGSATGDFDHYFEDFSFQPPLLDNTNEGLADGGMVALPAAGVEHVEAAACKLKGREVSALDGADVTNAAKEDPQDKVGYGLHKVIVVPDQPLVWDSDEDLGSPPQELEAAAAVPQDRKRGVSTTFTDSDVLFCRGNLANTHPGNKRYRAAGEKLKASYKISQSKRAVAEQLMNAVHGWDGKFLVKNKDGTWNEAENTKAVAKCMHYLRETKKSKEPAAPRAA